MLEYDDGEYCMTCDACGTSRHGYDQDELEADAHDDGWSIPGEDDSIWLCPACAKEVSDRE